MNRTILRIDKEPVDPFKNGILYTLLVMNGTF